MKRMMLVLIIALPLVAFQGPYKAGDGVSQPTLISKVEPNYTQEARDAKIQGVVQLSSVVDENGLAQDIKILRSLDKGLDENAILAVRQWRFKPGQKEGKPVAVQVTIEVSFKLL